MRRYTEMEVGVPVPLRLQQPLFIETDITYNLDMTKFPGLDDPQQMYEPALLIVSQENPWSCPDYSGTLPAASNTRYSSQPCRNHPLTQTQCRFVPMNNVPSILNNTSSDKMFHAAEESSPQNLLEDVLDMIDSCPNGLLDKLVDTNMSSTSSCDYTASRIPHCPSYLANGPCRPPTYLDNAQPLHMHNGVDGTRHWEYNTRVFPSRDGLTHIPDYVRNLSALSCVKTNACSKRKRSNDEIESDSVKRRCKAPQSMGAMYHYGYSVPYSGQYQSFHETMFGRSVMT
ncbi:uncharacterized protein LOC124146619 [Haliotis rufescens]|uniref:uncharacterized protein LOC124146619 n=1 Tax=Haliotis rufescens TaxID=6454 RepID=UPI00201F456B|nr:uncharacterized protein LOC124146619 [Haliotis rufescens]